MRRVFWIGVGVTITVVVVVKGRQMLARYAPAALVDQATDQVNELGGRATTFVRVFREEFRSARDEREEQLRASLLADGQAEAVDAARAARAAGRHGSASRRATDGPVDETDDDEDLLGYSF